jgi:DNA-binding MarR family transcriptional regulator
MIDDLPIYMAVRLYKAFVKKQRFLLSKYDLTEHHIAYLMIIHKSGGIKLTELTELLDVDKAATTRIVKRLTERGYVIKGMTKPNERKYKVYLSDKGRQLIAELQSNDENAAAELLQQFSAEEKAQLAAFFKKILTELEDGIPALSGKPVYLSIDTKNDAVILDIAEYNRLTELDLIAKLNQADEDIKAGRVRTHKEVFNDLRERIKHLQEADK